MEIKIEDNFGRVIVPWVSATVLIYPDQDDDDYLIDGMRRTWLPGRRTRYVSIQTRRDMEIWDEIFGDDNGTRVMNYTIQVAQQRTIITLTGCMPIEISSTFTSMIDWMIFSKWIYREHVFSEHNFAEYVSPFASKDNLISWKMAGF